MSIKEKIIAECKCNQCGHQWISRVPLPRSCPGCKKNDWNENNKKEELLEIGRTDKRDAATMCGCRNGIICDECIMKLCPHDNTVAVSIGDAIVVCRNCGASRDSKGIWQRRR